LPFGKPHSWALPEREEPFVAISDPSGKAELLSLHRTAPIDGLDHGVLLFAAIAGGSLASAGLILVGRSARWIGGLLAGVAALLAAFCWVVHAPSDTVGREDGSIVVDIIRPDGVAGSQTIIPDDAAVLGSDAPRAMQFLQNRMSIVDPGRVAACRGTSAPQGCQFNRIAVLPAYQFLKGKPPRVDLLLIGIRSATNGEVGRVAIRHLSRLSLGVIDCNRSDDPKAASKVVQESGETCETFSLPEMMLVPFDAGAGNLAALIIHRDGFVGDRKQKGPLSPVIEPDLLAGRWVSLPESN
jgi:hypothetical protein